MCPQRVSPDCLSPLAVGSNPHWAKRSTPLVDCTSLRAIQEAQNKNCLKWCIIHAKARWDGPAVTEQVFKMRRLLPLCLLLPGWSGSGEQLGRAGSSSAHHGTWHEEGLPPAWQWQGPDPVGEAPAVTGVASDFLDEDLPTCVVNYTTARGNMVSEGGNSRPKLRNCSTMQEVWSIHFCF